MQSNSRATKKSVCVCVGGWVKTQRDTKAIYNQCTSHIQLQRADTYASQTTTRQIQQQQVTHKRYSGWHMQIPQGTQQQTGPHTSAHNAHVDRLAGPAFAPLGSPHYTHFVTLGTTSPKLRLLLDAPETHRRVLHHPVFKSETTRQHGYDPGLHP